MILYWNGDYIRELNRLPGNLDIPDWFILEFVAALICLVFWVRYVCMYVIFNIRLLTQTPLMVLWPHYDMKIGEYTALH